MINNPETFDDIIDIARADGAFFRDIQLRAAFANMTWRLQQIEDDVQIDVLMGLALAMAKDPKNTADMVKKAKKLLLETIFAIETL